MAHQQAVPPSYRIAGSPRPDGVAPLCFSLVSGLAPQRPGADDAPSQASRRRADLPKDRTTTGLIMPFTSSKFYPIMIFVLLILLPNILGFASSIFRCGSWALLMMRFKRDVCPIGVKTRTLVSTNDGDH